MENFQDRRVWIRIWSVLRGWILNVSISDRIRNPAGDSDNPLLPCSMLEERRQLEKKVLERRGCNDQSSEQARYIFAGYMQSKYQLFN